MIIPRIWQYRLIRRLTSWHLIGQIGLALLLVILVWSCSSVPSLREETGLPIIRLPFVRVLLTENNPEVTIDADGAFAIECLEAGVQSVYYSTQPVKVVHHNGRLLLANNRGDRIQENCEEINCLPRGHDSRLMLDQRRYRGLMKVLPYGGNVRVVNVLYMEDYLRGVVPPEIGPREEHESEAIKAQATAARTYAMAHLQQYAGEPYDMRSTVADQLYEGMDTENRLVNRAVDETAGLVARYQGNYISAYYHSTCGGMTDDITQVWDKPAQPYLKPVTDDDACSWSKYYTWKEQFTEEQLRGRLEQYLSSDRGRDIRLTTITDLNVAERTAGGRVGRLIVRTESDVYRFYKDRIRWAIGRATNPDLILPSDNFDLEIERDPQDRIVSVTFLGRGYGHGVGMCQCGAIGKARSGWLFERILKHYYTGIDIEKLY